MVEKLYEILNQFTKPGFRIETKIYREISNFISKEFKNEGLPLDSPLFYEEIAFAFMENGNCPAEWENVFYSPFCGKIDTVTKKYQSSYPDIKDMTPKMLSYWEKRSSKVSSSVLQCRYAGLVWDFSKKIRGQNADISIAYKFIDSIIKMAELGGDKFLKFRLDRALRLAVSISDGKRILFLRDAIISYEDAHSEDDKPGTWGYSFDLLIGDKDLYKKVKLTEKQKSKIIKKLEERLVAFSDEKSELFNPHHVEHIISKLASYYRDQSDRVNLRRVLLIYKDSVLSGLKKGVVISGSFGLEKVRKILFQYDLSQEAKDLEANIRFYQKADHQNLQEFELPVKIPKEEIDNYIKKLGEQSLSQALHTIAISCIPDKDQSKKIVLEVAKKYPLSFMIPGNVMDHTGRKVAEIGPLEKDLDGHIVKQMLQSLQLSLPWIELGLKHLGMEKTLNADTFSEHLFESPVFLKEYHQIIKEGLSAYFNKNYIASCSILIPQIETAIRETIAVSGGETYQSAKSLNEQGFDLRPLGSLLRDKIFFKIFEKLNKNIPIYFQILLTDKRGFNFRNYICHGHFPGNRFNKAVGFISFIYC